MPGRDSKHGPQRRWPLPGFVDRRFVVFSPKYTPSSNAFFKFAGRLKSGNLKRRSQFGVCSSFMHIVHYITRRDCRRRVKENTLLTVEDQHHLFGDRVTLITGPGIGPEGSLEERALRSGLDLRLIDASQRARDSPLARLAYLFRELERLSYAKLKPGLRCISAPLPRQGSSAEAVAARLKLLMRSHDSREPSFHYGQHPLAHHLYQTLERWGRKADRQIHFGL